MSYRIWLDDQSYDPDTPDRHCPDDIDEEFPWRVSVSSQEAIKLFDTYGVPTFIDFDHDLGVDAEGKEDTAKTVCKYLFEHYPDAEILYNIHSANPDGYKWIDSYMSSWRKSRSIR